MHKFKLIPLEERIVLDAAAAAVIYVNAKAAPGGNGSSWAHAFNDVQSALNLAASEAHAGATSETIWVAKGTYAPTVGTFVLPTNLAIYGGFAGNETSLNQRNIAGNPTILSGDLLGNDINNPSNPGYLATKADNAMHVVTAIGVTATLDGVTIIDGYATGTFVPSQGIFNGIGAGIVDINSNLTVKNSIFSNNFANQLGAAIAQENLFAPGNLTISNSQFLNNSSGMGGGAVNTGTLAAATSLSIDHSTFINNRSGFGGAIADDSTPLRVTNSAFINNTAAGSGGAVVLNGYQNDLLTSTPSITGRIINSTFIGNTALASPSVLAVLNNWFVNTLGTPPLVAGENGGGGAIFNGLTGNLTIQSSTFIQNSTSGDGGAIANGGSAVNVGVLLFAGGTVSADNNLFIDNQAINGAAIASELVPGSLNSSLNLQLTNSILTANEATSRGGAVFMDGTSARVTGNLFALNEASSADEIWASNSVINNLSTTLNPNAVINNLTSNNFFLNLAIQDDLHLS